MTTAAVWLLGAGTLPLVFLDDQDMEDAPCVEIVALAATTGQALFPKDPARPTLWHWPVAVEQKDGWRRDTLGVVQIRRG